MPYLALRSILIDFFDENDDFYEADELRLPVYQGVSPFREEELP